MPISMSYSHSQSLAEKVCSKRMILPQENADAAFKGINATIGLSLGYIKIFLKNKSCFP